LSAIFLQVINSLVSIDVDGQKHDPRRVFLSEEKNDNVLDCIISKVKIVHVDPNVRFLVQSSLVLLCT
jgi:DNA (cytosine-5)-methyltransferase 1